MIYGLYLSATGVLASSHRQDVIANNLANSETVGFRRDLALFMEQRTSAARHGLSPSRHSHPELEKIGGGLGMLPAAVDRSQGQLEETSGPLDFAIEGTGFLAVQSKDRICLTRNGQCLLNRDGELILANTGDKVLDSTFAPIRLNPARPTRVSDQGEISQDGQVVARLGIFDVPDPKLLSKKGGTLINHPNARGLPQSESTVRTGFLERSNVNPAIELTSLMDAQRQLEANANLIRYQDQTLGRLVNDVGRIG
jgi:flagellar basal-body rod protein FlgF